jgi:hypothetical protein
MHGSTCANILDGKIKLWSKVVKKTNNSTSCTGIASQAQLTQAI